MNDIESNLNMLLEWKKMYDNKENFIIKQNSKRYNNVFASALFNKACLMDNLDLKNIIKII